MVGALLEAGASPSMPDAAGNNAFHVAVPRPHPEEVVGTLVQLLLFRGPAHTDKGAAEEQAGKQAQRSARLEAARARNAAGLRPEDVAMKKAKKLLQDEIQ